MNSTPISLLERLRLPNQQDAWSRFVDLYTPMLYEWTRSIGLPPDEASDLLQEVFLLLLERLPEFQYDRGRSFRGWLRTVLLNKWREERRRRTARPNCAGGQMVDDAAAPDDVELLTEAEYRRQLSDRALELLQREFQPTTWKAFWECVVHDRPVAEVAAELDLTPNAVYVAKSRVLTRLRIELEGLLD